MADRSWKGGPKRGRKRKHRARGQRRGSVLPLSVPRASEHPLSFSLRCAHIPVPVYGTGTEYAHIPVYGTGTGTGTLYPTGNSGSSTSK